MKANYKMPMKAPLKLYSFSPIYILFFFSSVVVVEDNNISIQTRYLNDEYTI